MLTILLTAGLWSTANSQSTQVRRLADKCSTCSGSQIGTVSSCDSGKVWGQADLTKNGELACSEKIFWGPDGYSAPDPASYYCSHNEPVTWVYNLTVAQTEDIDIVDGVPRTVIWASTYDLTRPTKNDRKNFSIPGPGLYGCYNDTIVVNVLNVLDPSIVHGAVNETGIVGQMGISIHFHGMFQVSNQFMDGVSQVTQCPISNVNGQDGFFQYKFLANPGGTYWWHSHAGLEYGDGLKGPLTIYERPSQNPYYQDYSLEVVPPISISDWWHQLSQDMFTDYFFGPDGQSVDKACPENNITCTRRWSKNSWEGAYNCRCGGPTSDYRWTSGCINGRRPYQDMYGRWTNFYKVEIQPSISYRLRVINQGFNYALRFSIDYHNFDVIAADGQFIQKIENVDAFVAFPGERYDVILHAKSEKQLAEEEHGFTFFMRMATFNESSNKFNPDENSFERQWTDQTERVSALLVYASSTPQAKGLRGRTYKDYSADNADLQKMMDAPIPNINRIVDVSQFFDYTNPDFLGYALKPENWITHLKHFEGTPAPEHPGPIVPGNPVPDPDFEITLWIQGLMYPNYDLFLAKGPLRPYTNDKDMHMKRYMNISAPNVWARPNRPLSLTKGKSGTRNLDIWAPIWTPPEINATTTKPPRNSWKSKGIRSYKPTEKKTVDEYGNAEYDARDTRGITNLTNMIFVPANKWVRVVLQNNGQMAHPFHIHGFKAYILGHERRWGEGTGSPERPLNSTCTVNDSSIKPMRLQDDEKCTMGAPSYMNSFGPDLIPPIRFRTSLMYNDTSQLNLKDPAIRDMMILPPNGFNVFQFYTSNVGAWFFHCHLEFHIGMGMGLTWMVGADTPGQWLKGGTPPEVIVQQNEANCPDAEFEGPLQFY